MAGYVSAIRFYKGNLDTGTHTASLWTSAGTLPRHRAVRRRDRLRMAGGDARRRPSRSPPTRRTWRRTTRRPGTTWPRPTTSPPPVTNGPLTALADGTDGANGLYRYGATGFPTQSFNKSNYWVDVVFSASPPGPDTTAADGRSRRRRRTASAGVLVGLDGQRAVQRGARTRAPSRRDRPAPRPRRRRWCPRRVSWDAATALGDLRPNSGLAYSTTYAGDREGRQRAA